MCSHWQTQHWLHHWSHAAADAGSLLHYSSLAKIYRHTALSSTHSLLRPHLLTIHLHRPPVWDDEVQKRFPVEITSSITAPSSQSSRPSEPLHVLPSTSTTPCVTIKSAIMVPLDSLPQCCRAQSRQSCRTQCGGEKSLLEEPPPARFSKAGHG